MNTLGLVLDINGIEIVTGSIVGFTEDYPYNKETQGVVILPHSEIEGEGYTVPVYFFQNVNTINTITPKKEKNGRKNFLTKGIVLKYIFCLKMKIGNNALL